MYMSEMLLFRKFLKSGKFRMVERTSGNINYGLSCSFLQKVRKRLGFFCFVVGFFFFFFLGGGCNCNYCTYMYMCNHSNDFSILHPIFCSCTRTSILCYLHVCTMSLVIIHHSLFLFFLFLFLFNLVIQWTKQGCEGCGSLSHQLLHRCS